MTTRALVLCLAMGLAIGFAAETGTSNNTPSKWGFLFSAPGSDCPSNFCGFESKLLVIDSSRLRVAATAPHIFIPRSTGFWEVGLTLPKPDSKLQPENQEAGNEEM